MPKKGTSKKTADTASASTKKTLRQRAEDSLTQNETALTPETVTSLTPEEIKGILHELQVHQIELEMQNEELRQSQLALETVKAHYFDLYDLAPVGFFTIGLKGIIEEANLKAAVLLGVERGNLVGRPFTHFILPSDQDIYYLHFNKLLVNGATQSFELRLKQATRPYLWVSATAMKEPQGQNYKLVITDITDRKKTEQQLQASHIRLEETLNKLQESQAQLVKQERLAAVGQLAAGIAHDFNNILAVIILHVELSLKTHDLVKLYNRLQIILQQAEYAAELVQQIMDFGRRSIIQLKPLDLTPFLHDQIQIFRQDIPENIKMNLNGSYDTCLIAADENRLRQVITNLVLNARDSMPDGGQLLILTDRCHFAGDNETPLPDMLAGDWVRLTVQDTGAGIEPEILPHIFEPFFTTKGPGKGAGLGLAQVYGIVKQHNGYIEVHTTVGQGTAFIIYLPALFARERKPAAPDQLENLPSGHGETVLIVEDNDLLREAMVSALQGLNYRTETAVNGAAALTLLQQAHQEIDLVLSDLRMPKMDGKALFRAIKQHGLTVPMVVVSGHPSEIESIQTLMGEGLVGYLIKPVNIQALAKLLAQALRQNVS